MLRNILIISIICLYHDTFSQHFSKSINKDYISELVKKNEKKNTTVFTTVFKLPIIEDVKGNCHIYDIRFNDFGLEIALEWNQPLHLREKFQYAKVPWKDIFSGNVKYGLEGSDYFVPGRPVYYEVSPFETLQDNSLSSEKKIRINKNKIIIQSETITEILIPEKYTIIRFDASSEFLFLVVDSDQGYRDGELLIPFLTTQIFIVPLLP